MKLNKTMFIILVSLMIVVIFSFVIVNKVNDKKLVCVLEKELIEGFNDNEDIVINFKKGKINKIEYKRNIIINDYYTELGTYPNALKTVLSKGLKYLDDVEITTSDNYVSYELKLKDKGVVLDNLNIYYNNPSNKTSLRYDVNSDIDSENAIKVGDKVTKKELKEQLKELNFKCK